MADYSRVPPGATLETKHFDVRIPEEKLEQFKTLIRLAPIGAEDFNNSNPEAGDRYGIRRDWLASAKKYWEDKFDWRQYERRINSYPNFIAPVRGSEGELVDVHFVALFSERPDALPIAVSFLECTSYPETD